MNEAFRRLAKATAGAAGKPWTFLLAALLIVGWAAAGPLVGFSDTWQLMINTGTTIVTFLMVFLIQNSQNRDAQAIHLKLDELLRAVADARNGMIDLEDLSDEQLARLREEFQRLCRGESRLPQGESRPPHGESKSCDAEVPESPMS